MPERQLTNAVKNVLKQQKSSNKPLAVILAGHNGSGKSTMWQQHLVENFQIPLINADRMMLSILPEGNELSDWAKNIRDNDKSWMIVAQKGVEAFVAQAMIQNVPFAMETVFSHWKDLGNGRRESKIDLIKSLQSYGYFVILFFVGLTNHGLSEARVHTRVLRKGHAVAPEKLIRRFPRTQTAIHYALPVADATILTDNSRSPDEAFTVCRIQMKDEKIYDCRDSADETPTAILEWLNVICPIH